MYHQSGVRFKVVSKICPQWFGAFDCAPSFTLQRIRSWCFLLLCHFCKSFVGYWKYMMVLLSYFMSCLLTNLTILGCKLLSEGNFCHQKAQNKLITNAKSECLVPVSAISSKSPNNDLTEVGSWTTGSLELDGDKQKFRAFCTERSF